MINNADTVTLGGDLVLNRIGLGTNRVTDSETSREVLRSAADLGVNLIDTADIYTDSASEAVIGETLAGRDDVHIATKGGMRRGQDPSNDPTYLRAAIDASLRRLRRETIDLYYLHRVADDAPFEMTIDVLRQLRDDGKIRHIGLSNVTVEQVETAGRIVEIAAVQNQYSVFERANEPVLEYAERHGIVFVPWGPLKSGVDERAMEALTRIATNHEAQPQQVILAWLLRRSPWMLPIPGTQSIEHLKANLAASAIELSDEEFRELSNAGQTRDSGTAHLQGR